MYRKSYFTSRWADNFHITMSGDLKIRPFQHISTSQVANLGHAQNFLISEHFTPHIHSTDVSHKTLPPMEIVLDTVFDTVLVLANYKVSLTRNDMPNLHSTAKVDDCPVYCHVPGSALILPSHADMMPFSVVIPVQTYGP